MFTGVSSAPQIARSLRVFASLHFGDFQRTDIIPVFG